jgi:hypothetical protein
MRLVASSPNSKPIPEAVREPLDLVCRDDLRGIVERISAHRPHGIPENEAVRRMIFDLLTASQAGRLGVEVDGAGSVVVGDPSRAGVLVGAHYDSIPSTPGADDNASGVAALIAAARAVGPTEGVCFIAFDGEWPAPQKLVHRKWESLGRLCPGGAHEEATDRRRGGATAPRH